MEEKDEGVGGMEEKDGGVGGMEEKDGGVEGMERVVGHARLLCVTGSRSGVIVESGTHMHI